MAAAAVLTVLYEGCIKEFSVVILSGVLLGEAEREHEVSKDAPLQGEEEMRGEQPRARETPTVKGWVRGPRALAVERLSSFFPFLAAM